MNIYVYRTITTAQSLHARIFVFLPPPPLSHGQTGAGKTHRDRKHNKNCLVILFYLVDNFFSQMDRLAQERPTLWRANGR